MNNQDQLEEPINGCLTEHMDTETEEFKEFQQILKKRVKGKWYVRFTILWLISFVIYIPFAITFSLGITNNVGMWTSLAFMWIFLILGTIFKHK